MIKSHPNRLLLSLWFLVFLLIVFKILSLNSMVEPHKASNTGIPKIEYFEDDTGRMTLNDIMQNSNAIFTRHGSSSISFGKTRFASWIRIRTDYLRNSHDTTYLSVSNTTLQRVSVYVPYPAGYNTLQAGWGVKEKQTETFIYPVFKLDSTLLPNSYIYIRTTSPFVQNFCFNVLTYNELNHLRLTVMIVVGLFIGMLLFMTVYNLIQFLRLKDKIHFYYSLYIGTMIAYQSVLLGLFNLWGGGRGDAITSNTASIGLLMASALCLFHINFLDIKKNLPKYYPFYIVGILLSLTDAMLDLAGLKYEASVCSDVVVLMIAVLGSCIAVAAVRKKITQAKYFLAGWGAMLCGIIIFLLRSQGILPNNEFSLFSLLLTAVIEAFAFSTALVDRIQLLTKENEEVAILYKTAEEMSVANETAFLQSQIKPHFLFNTLNTIEAFTISDPKRATDLIDDLSAYLRGNFDFENYGGLTPLENEISIVKAYVSIEKARFGDKIRMEYDIDASAEILVPMLLIQPLVENAIRHGVINKPDMVTVKLSIRTDAENTSIMVSDDGVGISDEKLKEILNEKESGSGVGLKNIQRRLMLYYGSAMEIQSEINVGTTIKVVIPSNKEVTYVLER